MTLFFVLAHAYFCSFAYRLRVVTFNAVPWLTDRAFALLHSVPELRIVQCHNRELTVSALTHLPASASLRFLHVGACSIIGDETLGTLTQRCALIHLSLANLSCLNNRTLSGDFSHLAFLELESFTRAAHEGLMCKVVECMPNLHHVNLMLFDGCGSDEIDGDADFDFQSAWVRKFTAERSRLSSREPRELSRAAHVAHS